jgi:hypothetical protein
MNYSEYLRRKMESLPVVHGPPQLKDESLRTATSRYRASARCGAGVTPAFVTTCCGVVGTKPGDGQRQEWSRESITNRAAGRAICGAGRVGYVYKGCCPPESTVEQPRDASGALVPETKPAAYKGKVTCCPAVGPPLYMLPPTCCKPPGTINTLLANDMPADRIPFPVPLSACCPSTIPTCPNPCCDENGFLAPGANLGCGGCTS